MRKFALAAMLLPVLAAAAQNSEFDYELAFDPIQIPGYDTLRLTSDDRRLAYTLQRKPSSLPGEQKYDPHATPGYYLGASIQLAERQERTGKLTSRALCNLSANSWAGAWSHDDSKLAFYSDAGGQPGLWLFDGSTCKQLGNILVGGVLGGAPSWSADDRKLYLTSPAVATEPAATKSAAITVFSAGGEGEPQQAGAPISWAPSKYSILEVDVASGNARTLVPADAEPTPVWQQVSASGRWLTYLSAPTQKDSAAGFEKSLVAVSLVDGTRQTIASGLRELWPTSARFHYTWHPSADRLVYWNDGGIYLVDLSGAGPSEPQRLAPELGRIESSTYSFTRDGRLVVGVDPVHADKSDRPDVTPRGLVVISLDGRTSRRHAIASTADFISLLLADQRTAWQPDACCITYQQRDKTSGRREVVRADIATGRQEILWQGHADFGNNFIATHDHKSLFSVYEDLQTAENISVFSPKFTRERAIVTDPRMDAFKIGAAETFQTVMPGYLGALETVRSTVLLPPGAKRGDRLPAIVMIYPGGDLSNRIESFGGGAGNTIPSLVYTSRGFAVLMANVKLGPEKAQNDVSKQMVDSLLPQVYRASELGYIDIERVALSGQSYGGYSTALIASQTNLFRAAIPVNGVFDIAGSYGRIDNNSSSINITWSEHSQGRMGVHPWAGLTRYIENSPYYRADRIYTPLLLLSGEADTRVPSEESRRMFTALRRLDKPVQLALYAGQGHVVSEWTRASAVDASRRSVEFLRKHLQPAAPK
ncbi:S9 family peptidase [Steroidobacter flavus]|uniref:S9 family peptidase n=1 Tax=Steroidobacter flavus TaxID=1842136 RepID=A0ABV8SKR5_9GAMM